MQQISDPKVMQQYAKQWFQKNKSVGFVPTMGALHAGHLSLVKKSKKENDITVVSLFVNPAQFGPNEDYLRYPKTLAQDLHLLKELKVDVVFIPTAQTIYPVDYQTRIEVKELSEPLCGKFRPVFFSGVATIVLKLFNLVIPTRAYFGQKDYQQLQVIKRMVKDLNLRIEIIPCPIVREEDGLAMSSRNTYLSTGARKDASQIYAALHFGKQLIEKGGVESEKISKQIESKIRKIRDASIDYVSICDPQTLQPVKKIKGDVLIAAAVRIDGTRLIDNILVIAKKR